MSILKITSTGVECRPHLPELGWRLRRSAFTRLKSSSSSSSSSRRASSGSKWRLSLGTNSKRFTGSYRSTIMVASGPVGFLGIRILQDRPISHRKLVLDFGEHPCCCFYAILGDRRGELPPHPLKGLRLCRCLEGGKGFTLSLRSGRTEPGARAHQR